MVPGRTTLKDVIKIESCLSEAVYSVLPGRMKVKIMFMMLFGTE